ncbi:MAG: hypothetical protein H6573_19035 [Lewinellaceae bacterium]|nr:hypothetical protein [Lewinellaceae bacterium]
MAFILPVNLVNLLPQRGSDIILVVEHEQEILKDQRVAAHFFRLCSSPKRASVSNAGSISAREGVAPLAAPLGMVVLLIVERLDNQMDSRRLPVQEVAGERPAAIHRLFKSIL